MGAATLSGRRENFTLTPIAGVSVIIPCFEAAETIERALASVAAQSLRPAEVIVVDDGSRDATLRVLDDLVAAYGENWLRVFRLPVNRGPAAARNFAWSRATQPLLAFLDADDTWHPEKLALQVPFMLARSEYAFCGHRVVENAAGLPAELPKDYEVSEYALRDLAWGNPFRTPGVLLRRGVSQRFCDGQRHGEDFYLWLGLLANGRRAAFIDLPLAVTHKPAFGSGGQSLRLWAMERGELRALGAVRAELGWGRWSLAVTWSLLKFVRRCLLTAWRRVPAFGSEAVASVSGRPGGKPLIVYLVTDDWFFLLHRRALARAALEAGFRVVVATAPGKRSGEIRADGFEFCPLQLTRSSRNPLRELLAIVDIFRLYRRLRPDIVHQVSIKPILYGSLAARLARVPAVVNAVTGLGFVFISGGRGKRFLRKTVETAYRLVGRRTGIHFLFENPDDRRHFLVRGILPVARTSLILGSGVDTDRFRPLPKKETARENGADIPVVLLAARLLWHKGIREFVTAARILRERGVPGEFQLAGLPDESNPAAVPVAVLLSWHRQGLIRWLGYCDDMPGLYRRVDIVCLPTTYREGIPVTLLEAAACGKPLVATAMPGCVEIVRPGENGYLVPPGGAAALADSLEKLLRDPELRSRFGASGRRLVKRQFSQERVIDATFSVYRELLGERWPQVGK